MENLNRDFWDLLILDGVSLSPRMSCVAAGDIDGDGKVEIIGAGDGLLWYRPETRESGLIFEPGAVFIHGGMKLGDIDGDGILEIITGESPTEPDSAKGINSLVWYKPSKDLNQPWDRYVVDPAFPGYAHDLILADLDGTSDMKIIAGSVYTSALGLYVYQRGSDHTTPWKRNAVSLGYFADGTCIGDLDGDGVMEIVCGPDIYKAPEGGVMAGEWHRNVYAPAFREMCLTTLADITGAGRPDIVVTEAEYMNGRLSWFENRMLEDPEHPWVEHFLRDDMTYAHSLFTIRDGEKAGASFVIGEMEQGGWSAPYNFNARVLEFSTENCGESWVQNLVSKGEGTHQAIGFDIDKDGEMEIIGESNGKYHGNPRVQIWKRGDGSKQNMQFAHRFIDREMPGNGAFILSGDIDGDRLNETICGRWWYGGLGSERHEIPGVSQALCLYDVDGDGRLECIAEMEQDGSAPATVCWLKLADPDNGIWETYKIGECSGKHVSGALAAGLLPDGQAALVLSYANDDKSGLSYPEMFIIPAAPYLGEWKKTILAEIPWDGQMIACDIDNDGKTDIVAGGWWLKNNGDGKFHAFRFAPDGFVAGGVAIADINGDGRPDIILGQHRLDEARKITPWSDVLWFENSADPQSAPWPAHGIDSLRCVHSISACDIDDDGTLEIICGEHDPYWQYRSQCRLVFYKKTDPSGIAWTKHVIDDRFEHYDGAKIVKLPCGNKGIISHGRSDTKYLNLWELRS